ncbi:MAG: MFS transporter [Gammaproteobacteria bacterium]|nr:MFS transporter [Gammaproteobacteria bacterium]
MTSRRVVTPSERPFTGLYELLVGDEDARVCEDIPESACREQPKNFFLSLASYFCSKVGDQVASASLVLPWLLGAIGAPPFMAGLLVPIRESGALLPQLLFAGFIRPFPVRKWFWVAGSVGQALCVAGMLIAGLLLSGTTGGIAIVVLLVVFSVSRGVASVASKDVLGKTVSKRRRGTMMGYASALAGVAAAAFGLYFSLRAGQQPDKDAVLALLAAASILWFTGACFYSFLSEAPGATGGGGNAIVEGVRSLRILRDDRPFRDFVIARSLLLAVALSSPFYVVLARENTDSNLGSLSLLLIASGLAGSLSAPIWGRMSDLSSRSVMMISALICSALGLLVFALIILDSVVLSWTPMYATVFFVIGIAHSGARLGRKTHLVDMATAETRASYVAVSNTVIGVLILAGGLFGLLAQFAGTEFAIAALAVMSLCAALVIARLPEAQ